MATAGLAEVAGVRMYAGNAFRIAGLPTDADRRTVRQRQQQLVAAMRMGADVDLDVPAGLDEVRSAFDRILGDPRRRLVEELFWLWDTENATCGCRRAVHREHDTAVLTHSAALDAELRAGELSDDQLDNLEYLWGEAARLWTSVLGPEFWEHVRRRIAALDDRQLDESLVAALRQEVPVALVKPMVELAADGKEQPEWLIEQARQWPLPRQVLEDMVEDVAAPLRKRLASVLEEVFDGLDRKPPPVLASVVYEDVIPRLEQLEALVPHTTDRRTANIRNRAAVALNNTALRVLEREGPAGRHRTRPWFETASELAVDDATRSAIAENLADLDFLDRNHEREQLHRRRRSRTRYPRERRGVWVLVAILVVLAAILYFVIQARHTGAGEGSAEIHGERPSGNAPVGTCLATREEWGTTTEMTTTACGSDHWAQVLGYLPATVKTPAPDDVGPFLGEDQVSAIALFRCGRLLVTNGLASDPYTVDALVPDRTTWFTTRGAGADPYVTCVVRRADDKPMNVDLVAEQDHDGALPDDVSRPVPMTLTGTSPAASAPLGSCLPAEVADLFGEVPVVDCGQAHWAEVIGYLTLDMPAWPGDKEAEAAARALCLRAAHFRVLPADYDVTFTIPPREWWDDADQRRYTACLAHRADDRLTTGPLS